MTRLKMCSNEARMLLLGGQVLLGFSFRICFEQKFEQIARPAQLAEIHRAGNHDGRARLADLAGRVSPDQGKRPDNSGPPCTFTTNVLDWALLPFAVGLALTLYTVSTALELPYSPFIGAAAGAFAIAVWFGGSMAGREAGAKQKVRSDLAQQEKNDRDKPDLGDRIKKVLIECRMALPGAQAFLGFQFSIVFAQGFEHLRRPWQVIHFASLLATTSRNRAAYRSRRLSPHP